LALAALLFPVLILGSDALPEGSLPLTAAPVVLFAGGVEFLLTLPRS
jgi:hypothetical protein